MCCSLPLDAAQEYWQTAAELVQAGEYAAACQVVDGLLADRPDDVLLLRIKGICLLETERETEAVSVLRHATEIEPTSVACRYYLAQALAYGETSLRPSAC